MICPGVILNDILGLIFFILSLSLPPPLSLSLSLLISPFSVSSLFMIGKFHFHHVDSRSLHYLSQAADPPDSPQQLQNHFEAWKVAHTQLLVQSQLVVIENIIRMQYLDVVV